MQRDEPDAGLAARVRDPLWFLARQWQVGEFTGEDAGSPVEARARVEAAELSRFHAGPLGAQGQAGQLYDPARTPLETLAEREPMPFDLRRSVEAGLRLLRLLDQHDVGQYRARFAASFPLAAPLGAPVGAETARLLRLAAGRGLDGAALVAALQRTNGALPQQLQIAPADAERVQAAVSAWLADVEFGQAGSARQAWQPERMEYCFAVAAPAEAGEHVLVAPEYHGGHLDWHAFDQQSDVALGAAADVGRRRELVRTVIPAPVTYRGMPRSRWWEFEDGQVNFGRVGVGPRDLLRLLLLGFALDYGNDWFVVPLDLPVGAVYRVKSLVVTNSFGERTLVPHYASSPLASPDWSMFRLSVEGEAGPADLLVLTPALASALESEPMEEVALLRDELANLAWAVEALVEDAGGRPFNRYEEPAAVQTPAPQPLPPGDDRDVPLHYRLSTSVPPYWFPLVPVRSDPNRPDVRLVRGRLLATDGATPTPLGRILEPGKPLALFEEEVTRHGTRVRRAYQYTRWVDGSGQLWISKRRTAGRGEGASRLRFDLLVPGEVRS